MKPRLGLLAVSLTLLSLAACERDVPNPPLPRIEPVAVAAGTAAAQGPDTSVPSADSVFNPAKSAPGSDAAAGRTNSTMTPAQQSSSMPVPGQNNDHSGPLAATKGASAP